MAKESKYHKELHEWKDMADRGARVTHNASICEEGRNQSLEDLLMKLASEENKDEVS